MQWSRDAPSNSALPDEKMLSDELQKTRARLESRQVDPSSPR